MTALTLPQLKFDRATILRGVAAGSAWGVTVSAALLGLMLHQCGTICLGQILDTAALSITAGIIAIGPVAMLRR
ncbi:hypothetical protein [Pseudorhodoplanes sp.]|uniref:hypothetical protein n=1 Tax=Pseudorhodoplanes sp. TaxID=1934341 RepID=UPI003D11E25D